jgi:AraC-like DNA-binding protein
MHFFKDLQFCHYNYLPMCRAWIDQRFDRHALNFCRSGRILWAMHDDKPRFLTAPFAWWTVPGPRYVYGSAPGESWEHFYVTFKGEHAAQMRHSDLIPASRTRHFSYLSDATRFSDAFFRLFNLLDAEGLQCPRAGLTLQDLFLQLHEQTPPVAQMSPVEIAVREWLEEVRAAPEKPWNVPEQALRLAISEVHLRRIVNVIVGMPPHRFIVERRLELCAARLRSSNEPIKVLAQSSGFTDVPHFTRLFTRRYSTPPAAYRCEVQLLETDMECISQRTFTP